MGRPALSKTATPKEPRLLPLRKPPQKSKTEHLSNNNLMTLKGGFARLLAGLLVRTQSRHSTNKGQQKEPYNVSGPFPILYMATSIATLHAGCAIDRS